MAGTLKLGGLEVISHQDSTNTLDFSSNVVASFAETQGTTTTGGITHGTNTLTVGSGTGIAIGDGVVGQGITPGTTVLNIVGTTVTLSANLNIGSGALSGATFTFYKNKLLTARESAMGLCKAWVNFNGIGTVAIRASFNVSSITDNTTGDYNVNLTTAMPDANYVTVGDASFVDTNQSNGLFACNRVATNGAEAAPSTTSVRVNSTTHTGSDRDSKYIFVAIFR